MTTATVFWDFDGTLASREGSWANVLLEAVQEVDPTNRTSIEGLTAGLDQGFPAYGPSGLRWYASASAWWTATSIVLRDACRQAGVSDSTSDHAVEAVPRIYYERERWHLLPGAIASVRATARAGLQNVVLSNHAPELPQLVADLGLEPHMGRTLTSASLGVEKPDPMMFALALRISSASPDSWMIGDSQTIDVEGAQGAGLSAVLVHRSVNDRPAVSLTEAADLVVQKLCCGAR